MIDYTNTTFNKKIIRIINIDYEFRKLNDVRIRSF